MTQLPIYIYCSQNTPRLRYALDLIFKDILKVDYILTNNRDQFIAVKSAKLSYDFQPVGDEIFFYSSGILFEKGVKDQSVSVLEWNGTKAIFATHPKYELPFDPFSASFYMASRYEEYLPHQRDDHDRFPATESIASKKDFLHQPVVNIYAIAVRDIILKKFPEIIFADRKYRFISTIDIDNAWAYLEKGVLRTTGAYIKSFINFNFDEVVERTKVLFGLLKDPYDTYNLQLALQKEFNFEVIYFFLLGEYGTNDRNVPVDSRKLRSLIKTLADYAGAGIHPSYASNKYPNKLKKELKTLRQILKREVTKSRQHFLVLKFPETYRNLIDLDIEQDYSMGYAVKPGFRAGLCTPFHYYDLDNEQKTSLVIHPFAIMDATLRYYVKVNPKNAMDHISPLINEVRNVNGNFISLWHNESLSENSIWKGWRPVYKQLVQEASA
jgi:uncharacterized protein DUF7033